MTSPKSLLLGRFAHQGFLKSQRGHRSFVALEADTGRRVVASVVLPGQLANLEAARGLAHRHLAQVIDLSRALDTAVVPEKLDAPAGAGVAIAELVPGRTLHRVLGGKPMSPAKAVACMLRIVDAVGALHARGAFHGAISPFSVIAEPEDRAIAPVLSQLVVSSVAPYCPPERLKGAPSSPSDDVWALFATLYTALTGQAPFAAPTRDALARQMLAGKPKPLQAFGVDEPALAEILERGLSSDRRQRLVDLPELTKLLNGWERDPRAIPPKRVLSAARPAPTGLIVGGATPSGFNDEELVIDPNVLTEDEGAGLLVSSQLAPRLPPPLPVPPPLPPSDAGLFGAPEPTLVALAREVPPLPAAPLVTGPPTVGRRFSINPFERKRRVWPLVVCAALLSGAGVYLAVGFEPGAVAPAAAAGVTATTPSPVKKVAKPRLDPTQVRDACVSSHFPEGQLESSQGFAFVCEDGDFREISRTLFTRASSTPDADPVRTAEKGELGWYELPATGIIRRSCCPGTPPVILPETTGWCEQLQWAVRRVADDSNKAGDAAPAARSFDKAVNCLYANRIPRPYLYQRPPNQKNRAAFQQFLSRAAISEARR
jgi:hypothetical protein